MIDVAGLARHLLDARDALLLGLVREHRARHAVADRVHARHRRLEALVNGDEAARIARDAERFEAEALHVGAAPDRHQHDVGGERLLGAVGARGDRHAHACVRHLRAPHLAAERERQALAREHALGLLRDLAVHAGQDPVEELHHRHLGAEPRPHRAELEADRTCTHHEQLLRHALELERTRRRHDPLLVDRHARERRRFRAGRDQDPLRLERAQSAAVLLHLDAAGRGDPRRARDHRDFVLLEQERGAARELGHLLALALHHALEVERDALDANPVVGQLVLRGRIALGAVQQRLRRDAADVQAGAAEQAALVDARGAHPELRGADRGHVAARAAADHHEVESIVRHHTSRSRRSGDSRRAAASFSSLSALTSSCSSSGTTSSPATMLTREIHGTRTRSFPTAKLAREVL